MNCQPVAFGGDVYCAVCITARWDAKDKPPVARAAKARESEGLEVRIGRDWLNRIGVMSLVVGVALFILYSFQYLGPWAKLAIGFAISAGLLGGGVWLERRESFRWYGFGLIGGGWALAYFTVYAMHHIPAVRVIRSPMADLILLAAVAAGAIRHSMRYRSETITALAVLLAFFTISISRITGFTLGATALLVLTLSWLVATMRWDRLFLLSVIGSYATHLLWTRRQLALTPRLSLDRPLTDADFWLTVGFVTVYWLVYHVTIFAFDETDRARRNRLMSATLANGVLYLYSVMIAMMPAYRDARYLVVLGLGVVYWASSLSFAKRQMPALERLHTLFGLVLITLAIPLKITGEWLTFLWTAEVPLLVWLGLRYGRWSYRLVAAGLACIVVMRVCAMDLFSDRVMEWLGMRFSWRMLMGCAGIASLGLSAWWYRQQRGSDELRAWESRAFEAYYVAAMAPLAILTAREARWDWVAAAWTLEAGASVALGLLLREPIMRLVGAIGCAGAAVQLLMLLQWDAWAVSTMVTTLYGLGWAYRGVSDPTVKARAGFLSYVIAGTALLALLLTQRVDRELLAVALSVQGLALVLAGFLVRERVFRLCGFAVSTAMVGVMGIELLSRLTGADSGQWAWQRAWAPIAMLFLQWGLYRSRAADKYQVLSDEKYLVLSDEQYLAPTYAAGASAVLTVLLWDDVPFRWLSVAWAIEGLCLISAGFGLRDKTLRVAGLAVFGLLVVKILFVDLAGAETIYRILSFIVAGVILLLASFAYTRHAGKRDTSAKS